MPTGENLDDSGAGASDSAPGENAHRPWSVKAALVRWRFARTISAWAASTPRNERLIYQEVTFQALVEAGAMSFMSVFLVRLNAPNWLVGLYASAPALMSIFVSLPVGGFVQGKGNLVRVANWARLVFRGSIGFFALLPLLPTAIAPYVLVGARTLLQIPAEASNVAFTTILGIVTPVKTRPRMLSTRLAVNGMAAALVGFLAGQWLNQAPYPLNYQLLFLTAVVGGLLSIYTLSFLQLPQAPPRPPQTLRRFGLQDIPALLRRAPAFRNFAIASFVFRITLSMPGPLYTIYRVRVLGASDAWIGTLLTAERLASVLGYFILARLLTREKYRRWLWACLPGMVFFPLGTALSTTPEMLLIPALLGGLFDAALGVFMTNTLFAVSPEAERPTFVAANVCLASITAFVAPLMGTVLADGVGITVALLVIAGVRFVSALLFRLLNVGAEQQA